MKGDQSAAADQARLVSEDVAALKADVAELIRQMRDLARHETGRMSRDAAETVSDKASDIYETVSESLSETGRRSADALSARIEERPFATLLMAFAAGFVFSKILTR